MHLIDGLSYALLAVAAWATFRTIRTGAHRALPWFFSWILASCFHSAFLLLVLGHHSPKYAVIWSWTVPIVLVLMAAMAGEAHIRCGDFSRDKRAFPVIALGLLALLAAVAAGGSAWLDGFDPAAMNMRRWAFLLQRIVPTWCCIFLSLSALLYRESGVPISGAMCRHRNIAIWYTASLSLGYLVMHMSRGALKPEATIVMLASGVVLMGYWSAVGPIDLELPTASDEMQAHLRREIQGGEDILKRDVVRLSEQRRARSMR